MTQAVVPSWRVASFEDVVSSMRERRVSFTEAEALQASHWDMGEDARLREDLRFRETPWGRWVLSECRLANELLYGAFVDREWSEVDLEEVLQQLDETSSERHVFCSGDPRFVVRSGRLRLAAGELGRELLVETEVPEIAKYTTHLPVHSLAAAAACEPAGEWGPGAHEEAVETLGWVRVDLPGRHLNDRMFVARIVGNSLASLHKNLCDGDPAVFEFWPEGDRKNRFVLVRGSFKDPDTGSFGVKKYVPEPRREDRTRSTIYLVSGSPDKERYPDIVLSDEDADSLAVVAELLTGGEPKFARRPKRRPPKGCRDLESDAAQERRFRHLDDAREKFFTAPTDISDNETGRVPPDLLDTWSSRLVMLSLDEGGLAIETSPLAGLPTFVKRIEVRCDGWSSVLLASNLRTKPWQTVVPPSSDPIEFVASGFEEDLAEEMAHLRIDGLSAEQAVAFRVDAFGVGRRLATGVVTPASHVRVLIPPGLGIESVSLGHMNELEGGWRVWDFTLPAEPTFELREQLHSLGLRPGQSSLVVVWTGSPPREYRRSFSGERYPCYRPGDLPVLGVSGASSTREGDFVLFVSGPGGTTRFSLPTGGPWHVAFDDAGEGTYLVDVVPLRRNQKPQRVAFAVDPIAGCPPAAEAKFAIDDVHVPLTLGSPHVTDLRPVDGGPQIVATAPPLWTTRVSWQGRDPFGPQTHFANDAGDVDLGAVLTATHTARSSDRFGRLVVDFGELGCARVEHSVEAYVETVGAGLRALLEAREEVIEQSPGRFDVLQKLWFEPVTRLLGYRAEVPDEKVLEGAPAGCSALLLEEPDLAADDVTFCPTRLLVVTPTGHDLRDEDESSVRVFAARACKLLGIKVAFFSDGFTWSHWKPGQRFMHAAVDVREVVYESAAVEDFLATFLAEHER